MRNCFETRPLQDDRATDVRLAEFHAALDRIHLMPAVAGLEPHDYVAMADALLDAYDSQPIKFLDDWRVTSFITDNSRQVGQCRRCAVLSSEAARLMMVRGVCTIDLSSPQPIGLSLGNPLFDTCMVVALDFPFDRLLQSLHGFIAEGAKPRDVLWFAWFHLVTSLAATVATCDETAINRVQRRISSFTSFAAVSGMRL